MNGNSQINYLVYSLILNEVHNLAPASPFPEFDFGGGFGEYVRTFNRLKQQRKPGLYDLQLPWFKTEGYYFWRYYCSKRVHDIDSSNAANQFIPFRRNAADFLGGSGSERITSEAFHYPFGLSVVITIRLKPNDSLVETIKAAQAVRFDQRYTFGWQEGNDKVLSLKQLGNEILDRQRMIALGEHAIGGVPTEKPFTIAAVIQGSSDFLNMNVVQGGEIHRALEGLSTWRRDWETLQNLPDLEAKTIPTQERTARENHLVYGDKLSRVIWFPAYFNIAGDIRKKLSCYHRNLVFATMQTMSLGRFLLESARMRSEGVGFSSRHRTYIRKAKELIRRLHLGQNTYRSESIKNQIEDNDYLEALQSLRDI